MDFVGEWRIDREITHDNAPPARFAGLARLELDGEGLSYAEAGELVIAGAPPMQAERQYLWRTGPTGGIEVFFADGRPFHAFDPNAAAPQDRHWCDTDIYDVRYDFGDWPDWRADWRVSGPRKTYRMMSRFSR